MTIAHPTCPLCGEIIFDDRRLLVDIDGGLVVRGHSVASLTRTEMAMFGMLWRMRPRTISKETLLAASAEPGRDDDRELKMVDVLICKLRKKLDPLEVRIGTCWGEGYRLEFAKRKASAA